MKKLLVLLMLLLPVTAWADDLTLEQVTTADGLMLSHTINRDRVWSVESQAECMTQAYLIDGEYEKAFALNQQLADLGDVDALARLGAHYLNGTGVAQDEARGLDMLRQSADAGVQRAQLDVVRCVLNGWGTEANAIEAARLLEDMIERCDKIESAGDRTESYTAMDCRLMLASLYRCGVEGTSDEPAKAASLFAAATAKTLERIAYWTSLCSDPYYADIYGHYLDHYRSLYAQAEAIHLSGELDPLLTTRPTPDLPDMDMASCQNHVWFAIGEAYEENTCYEDAARWFEMVIANGFSYEESSAHYMLGIFYSTGKLGYDTDKAISHFYDSLWSTDTNGLTRIGNLFRDGVIGSDGTVYLAPDADIANAFYACDADYDGIEPNTLIGDLFRDGGPVSPNAYLAARFYWAGSSNQYCADELTKLYKAGLVTDSRLIYSLGTGLPFIDANVNELILLLADDLIHDRVITWVPGTTDVTNASLARRLLTHGLDLGKISDPQAACDLLALLPEEE